MRAPDNGSPVNRQAELRMFLRSRRARISPAEADLPVENRRSTGLRREDVAELAGISVGWYGQFEVGRATNVSAQVLESIAHVLRLDNAEAAYLFRLCGIPVPPPAGDPSADLSATAQAILRAFTAPAYVLDAYYNVRHVNDAARAVLHVSVGDNMLRDVFLEHKRHGFFVDRGGVAKAFIANMHLHSAAMLDDPGYEDLLTELRAGSNEFAELWDTRDVTPASGKVLRVRCGPEVVSLIWNIFPIADRHFLILAAPADDESLARLDAFVGSRGP